MYIRSRLWGAPKSDARRVAHSASNPIAARSARTVSSPRTTRAETFSTSTYRGRIWRMVSSIAPQSDDFGPVIPCSLSGVGDVLAGESSANEIDMGSLLAFPPLDSGAYIVVSGYIGPVFGEDLAAERVDFDLADNGHSGAFQAEFQAADPSEQGQDVHCSPPPIRTCRVMRLLPTVRVGRCRRRCRVSRSSRWACPGRVPTGSTVP